MLGVSADDKHLRHPVEDGRRPSTPPSSWRAQASPTRPGQPSLASVGSGMAAGAASRTLHCANLGAVRSFSTICNVNVHMTHATSLPDPLA